ncbi:MAG: hypothetical protein ACRDK3_18100, partial [Actinomycetota bacterium]
MTRPARIQLIALLGLVVLVSAACGQKPGVSDQVGPAGAFADLDGDGIPDAGPGSSGGLADLEGSGSGSGAGAGGLDAGGSAGSGAGGSG